MTNEPDATVPRRLTRAGDYDLIRKMGAGGFGVVFEAQHRDTGLMYAVKRINLSVEDAERYRNEALYPARIASQSLHVLGVHSFFHDAADDVFYLVTELIAHGDLRGFLDRNPKPLPLTQALELAIGMAKGLAAIHAQGIIHRDLKPANVLMDRKDEVWVPKIADFGLARSSRSVSIGEFASSGYAAPEQLDLMSDQPLGPESDLFSFGMVLYELLTGEKPTTAGDLREYGRWVGTKRPPPPPSTVRAELAAWPQLDTLVASLLEFDRTRRTKSAADTVRTLTDVLRRVERGAHSEPEPVVSKPVIEPPTHRTHVTPPTMATVAATVPATTGATEWTRWQVLLVMAGVFAATGSAMTLALPWTNPAKFSPAIPESLLNFGAAPSLIVLAAWVGLPVLFGLALAFAVRLELSRVAVVAVLAPVIYQATTTLGLLSFAGANGTATPAWRAILAYAGITFLPPLAVLASLALWRRPSRRTVLITAASGLVAALCLFGLSRILPSSLIADRGGLVLSFSTWQVVIGLTIVNRLLFANAKTATGWSWKPVAVVAALALLLSGAGTWNRNRPVPLVAGQSKENQKDHAWYVWIPPGDFQMGCSPDDSECAPDEQPPHTVTFTNGFWLGTTEVTVRGWKVGERPLPPAAEAIGLIHNQDWSREGAPVMNITWQEARDYCAAMDGRLPTEAEWEYAARAGTSGARYGRLKEIARYADNSGQNALNTAQLSDQSLQEALNTNRSTMWDVSLLLGNPWALRDMLGNVAEWVEDDYAETTYSLATGGLTDPPPHMTGVARVPKVIRGGSWANRPGEVRASVRGRQAPDQRSAYVGMRCVWKGPEGPQ